MKRTDPSSLSGILIVAQEPGRFACLQRVTRHLKVKRRVCVSDLESAEEEIMKREPDAIILDVSDFSSGEFDKTIEPFIWKIPGWIKTFFIDVNSTPKRMVKASDLGVNGVLHSPISHHGITKLLNDSGSTDGEVSGQ